MLSYLIWTVFSPTQLKNYPVQGFATGDIVPEVLGRLRRVLTEKGLSDKVLLVNTVHDSVLFDVDKKIKDFSEKEYRKNQCS